MKAPKLRCVLVAIFFCSMSNAWAGPFAPGNLVVSRVGDPDVTLSFNATRLDLVEYAVSPTTATEVQVVSLPVARTGSNKICTISGRTPWLGRITISPNGYWICAAGYDREPGLSDGAGISSAIVNRIIALVDSEGMIDTSTALTESYNAAYLRVAVTDDGNNIWTGGGGTPQNNGLRFTRRGGTTSTALFAGTPDTTRSLTIFENQLYLGTDQYSSLAGGRFGPNKVGTGLPTTFGQNVTHLYGFPTTVSNSNRPSPYDFVFRDASIIYLADDRLQTSGGGVQRWDLVLGKWMLTYTLNTGRGGCRSVYGRWEGTEYVVYGVAGESDDNYLCRIVDTGPTSNYVVLATAGETRAFRGVAPTPIAQAPTDIVPTGYRVNFGVEATAPGVSNLQAIDANTVQLTLNPDQEDPNPVQMEVSATNGNVNPSSLNFNLVCRAESGNGEVYVEMFNFNVGDWVGSPSFPVTDSDALYTVAAPGTAGQFVNDVDGAMITRITGFLGAADSPTLPCWDFNYCYWN